MDMIDCLIRTHHDDIIAGNHSNKLCLCNYGSVKCLLPRMVSWLSNNAWTLTSTCQNWPGVR